VTEEISFRTRTRVRPEDLGADETLVGGSVLRRVDEEAAICAILQLGDHRAVTESTSSVELVSSTRFGRTSLATRAEVRNTVTHRPIVTTEEITSVNTGDDGRPPPHGSTDITHARDRFRTDPPGPGRWTGPR
jgi:acyl-CoA thioesterase YciA